MELVKRQDERWKIYYMYISKASFLGKRRQYYGKIRWLSILWYNYFNSG